MWGPVWASRWHLRLTLWNKAPPQCKELSNSPRIHITSAELSGLVDSVKRFIVIWLLSDDLFVRGEDMDIWNGRLPQCVTRMDYQRCRCWNDSFFANMWEWYELIYTAVKRFLHLNTFSMDWLCGDESLSWAAVQTQQQPSSTSTRSSDSIIRALLPLLTLSTRSNSRGGR